MSESRSKQAGPNRMAILMTVVLFGALLLGVGGLVWVRFRVQRAAADDAVRMALEASDQEQVARKRAEAATRMAEDKTRKLEQAEESANALRRTISAEIKTLDSHEWAGEYYQGDGLGVNVLLLLAPESGFLFEWHGCMGLYDRNYGSVSGSEGRVRLSFTFENNRKGFQGIAEEFAPITWGDRKYLVPADEIVGFCNAVNDGSEPRKDAHGIHLLRRGDEEKDARGLPIVPEEFKPYLLSRPIEVDVVSVGRRTLNKTLVVLNCGKKHGLLPGMQLHVVKPDHMVESVTVTTAEDERSEATMAQIFNDDRPPQVGWKLSTRCPWHAN